MVLPQMPDNDTCEINPQFFPIFPIFCLYVLKLKFAEFIFLKFL